MKIVVIGGTGLIGRKVCGLLTDHGHEVAVAAPSTGVDTLTGVGLAEVMTGATAVVDVSNSPTFDGEAVLRFFTTSTRNILDAEATAGVSHHIVLSVVGTERLADSPYFHGKLAQEELVRGSSMPYSIVHATQFFEFLAGIADAATDGDTVRLAPVLIAPMAADDVAATVARTAVGVPVDGTVEVAGPETFRLDELVSRLLRTTDDPRRVVTDPTARYFGNTLAERSLLPGPGAAVGGTRLQDWLDRSTQAA